MDLKAGELSNKRRDIKRELERLEEQIAYNTSQLTSMDKELSILDPTSEKAKNIMGNRKYFSDPLPKFEKEISNLKSELKNVDNEKKKMVDKKIKEGELKIEELEKKKKELQKQRDDFDSYILNLSEELRSLFGQDNILTTIETICYESGRKQVVAHIEFRDKLANLEENIDALNDFLDELKEERDCLGQECLELDK